MVVDEIPKRIEIVYRDALDNISFTKKQQWIVAGYVLTCTLPQWQSGSRPRHSICLRILLTIAISLAALYGVAFLYAASVMLLTRRLARLS
jgi:hypothetical protein